MTNMSNTTTVRFHMGGESDIKTAHNRRDEATVKWEKHIDMERKHIVLKDMELEEAYAELFGEAIEEYADAKQKRRDRKIGGVREYMEQVRADARGRVNKKTREKGKNLAYEVIVGIGSVKPVVDESTGRYKRDEDGEILMPFLVPEHLRGSAEGLPRCVGEAQPAPVRVRRVLPRRRRRRATHAHRLHPVGRRVQARDGGADQPEQGAGTAGLHQRGMDAQQLRGMGGPRAAVPRGHRVTVRIRGRAPGRRQVPRGHAVAHVRRGAGGAETARRAVRRIGVHAPRRRTWRRS